jgi:hypothetical protein
LLPQWELIFYGVDYGIQQGKVAVVNRQPPRQFPNSLDGVQIRTIGRQEIQRKAVGRILRPSPMEPGMMVAGIVQDDDHPSATLPLALVEPSQRNCSAISASAR